MIAQLYNMYYMYIIERKFIYKYLSRYCPCIYFYSLKRESRFILLYMSKTTKTLAVLISIPLVKISNFDKIRVSSKMRQLYKTSKLLLHIFIQSKDFFFCKIKQGRKLLRFSSRSSRDNITLRIYRFCQVFHSYI